MGQDIITLYYPKLERKKYKTVHIDINYEDFIFDEDNQQYEPTIFEYTLETMKLVILDHYSEKETSQELFDFLNDIDKTKTEIEKFLLNQKERSRRVFNYFIEKEETLRDLSDAFVRLMYGR